MNKVDLGSFLVDVKMIANGVYDVYIAHEGSSGEHYTNVTADRIGELLAGDIECISEVQNLPSIEEVRAINIKWDTDTKEDLEFLPKIVVIPENIRSDTEEISDWLSDEYGFCHGGFELDYMSNDDLAKEEVRLKKAIYDAGVNTIEEFLGHDLSEPNLDLDSEFNDVLAQMPEDVYLQYVANYLQNCDLC